VVTAIAIPMTFGSCLAGRANRAVSGATASQPTNESISVAAACPTDIQPCGANGLQYPILAEAAEPATATVMTATSRPTSRSCAPVLVRSPLIARTITTMSSSPATAAVAERPPPASRVT